MPPPRLLLPVLLLLLIPAAIAGVPDRYTVRRGRVGVRAGNSRLSAQEYLDPTYPVPRPPPVASPTCVVPVLTHSFGDTYGAPPATAAYAPPADCPAPWSLVSLSFSVAVAGDQYDRVAAVWLDGVELLRTTTAEPAPGGVRWTVRRDVTRYASLLRAPPGGVLSVMLENLVNDEFTGVFNVSISFQFHGAPAYLSGVNANAPATLPKSYFEPADLILPVSDPAGESTGGFWFRLQNASHAGSRLVTIPSNAYRAVLEVFVSPHADDEFWYSNPPDLYIRENNLSTARGNAAYREVVAAVDRRFAGSFVPFPVVYTGGVNPLFWQPVAALGAFHLPSYDLELTPFLGLLADGKAHEVALTVVDAIAEWRVDANLHLWLDPNASDVAAAVGPYRTPRLSIKRRYATHRLDGRFSIRAKRKARFSGWVSSSFGNFTTEVETEAETTSVVEFANQGNNKTVRFKAERESEVVIRAAETRKEVGKVETEAKFPMLLRTVTEDGENGTSVVRANLTHSITVETSAEAEGLFERESKLADEQTAAGWMLVSGHDVVNGSAATASVYRYSDDAGRYERAIDARDGSILSDNVTESYQAVTAKRSSVAAM
ncbi:hypothetical protein PR202_gb01098 [Eleusine coracana subsp. coracana]|uniref:Peptide N-acetyl-beta-D-glucosaminyl asparaginase amidase A N-terminal domain-containing protein n=1 Tax=Eleusine coracana subsp. coracana TaxID=191504 RepID=A0AAV5DTA6_ELECO|nr:hypothetical protein QOZ80_5BG0422050 [Eleusine coracana subsp. coracana]GJN14294.1 hypothetical protein PR202_gb01098 [Eleusine coracana subsp. coracana]